MKGNMNNRISVAMAALVVTVLVGCGGNKTVAPPVPPPVNPQGGYTGGGGGGCGQAVQGINNFFSYLQVQYNGLSQQGGQQQQGGLPSSLSLVIASQGGQQIFGQPQSVTASGCFNWAELGNLYGPTYPGQPQQARQTGVQINSNGSFVQIDGMGYFQNMVLNGSANMPSFGMAASPTPIVLFIRNGQVLSNQGNRIMAQTIEVYIGNQVVAAYGTANPQQGYPGYPGY